MKKCMRCGLEVPDGSRFCNHCGLETEAQAVNSPPAYTNPSSYAPPSSYNPQPSYAPPSSYSPQPSYAPNTPSKKRLVDKPLFWVAVMAPVALLFIVIAVFALNGGGDSGSNPYPYSSPSDNGYQADNSEDVFLLNPDNTAAPQNDVLPQADSFDPGSVSLYIVPFPPSNRMPCEECDSTGLGECVSCNGTGKGTQNTMDRDLLEGFGLGGLQDTLNNLPCTLCGGSGEWDCIVCYGTGDAFNPDYSRYYNDLVTLSEQTGMRIFALEDNQISPYLGFYYCKLCKGLGYHPELKVHETDLPLCQQCFSEGVRYEFLDSFTEEELYRDYNLIYDASVYDALGGGNGGNSGYDGYDGGGSCLVDGCTNPTAGGHPYCSSHQAAPGPDFGVEGTGYCPMCGEKVYTSDAYCARCR